MKYLLDTCVISELVAKRPNLNGEIAKGIEKLPKSKRKQELHDWLSITAQGSREKGLIEPSKSGVGFDYNFFRLGDFASFSLDSNWKIATTPSVSQVIAFFRRATLRCNTNCRPS